FLLVPRGCEKAGAKSSGLVVYMDYGSRKKKFQQTLDDHQHLDGFVVTHPANLRYLCGFTGSHGLLLFLSGPSGVNAAVTGYSKLAGRLTFFTDGRYSEQAREEVGEEGEASGDL